MILDSSAIIGILQKFKGKAISILEDKFTLDLALYELGNVIWKEWRLTKRIQSRRRDS